MIIKSAIFLILLYALFLILNGVLFMRSRTHNNKFIENALKKLKLTKHLKTNKLGWNIITVKSNKSLIALNNLLIPAKSSFSINNSECSGVADPFLFKNRDIYYLFFEYEYHKYLKKGADLALATSKNGLDWVFQQKILQEPFHQSFPYVFKIDEDFYMLPESYQSNQIRLYKAESFPIKWALDTILFEGLALVDTVFLNINETYYWFTTNLKTSELLLFYSDGLKGKWEEHPCSPISKSNKKNRNGGPIINENNIFYRIAQDGTYSYGDGLNLYKISEINKSTYIEIPIKEPLFYKDKGIIKDAIHHLCILNEGANSLMAIDGANFAINGIRIV